MAQRKPGSKPTAVAKQGQAKAAAKAPNKILLLSQFLEGRRQEIAKVLPQHLDVERVIKTAIMAAMESEEIGEKCTAMSIYRSVVQASLMGLTVGSGFNEGYFIRYGNACTFRASYLGWTKIAQRSEGVDIIRASVVHENDHFVMSEHPPTLEHQPRWKGGERGAVVGAVSVAYTVRELKDGRTAHVLYDFAFVDGQELDQARLLADKYKESPSWRVWPGEMRKKVAVRRLCKWLPRTDDLNRLTRIENSADSGVVDVPDLDIDNVQQMVADTRFPEASPAQLPAAQAQQAPASNALPEPEVLVDSKPPPTAKAAKAAAPRQTATSRLKRQISNGKPSSAPAEKPPPPGDGDAPDYGGPDGAQPDMDF